MALIYIVEDDSSIREVETIALSTAGYQIRGFEKASSFFAGIEEELPDLVLLDIMLPDEDGYSIIRSLREDAETKELPVIFVTAKTSEFDMLKGLDDGADDYIRKPFSVAELLSRVRALLRRTLPEEAPMAVVGQIRMDHDKHTVYAAENPVELTFKEYELLRYLMKKKGTVLDRETILKQVWDTDFVGESRTVDMHIKTLRQKLGACGKQIQTIRNVGYVLQERGNEE